MATRVYTYREYGKKPTLRMLRLLLHAIVIEMELVELAGNGLAESIVIRLENLVRDIRRSISKQEPAT